MNSVKFATITKIESHIIETKEKTYQRYGPNGWDELMGESWESVYDCVELEEEFQRWMR